MIRQASVACVYCRHRMLEMLTTTTTGTVVVRTCRCDFPGPLPPMP